MVSIGLVVIRETTILIALISVEVEHEVSYLQKNGVGYVLSPKVYV